MVQSVVSNHIAVIIWHEKYIKHGALLLVVLGLPVLVKLCGKSSSGFGGTREHGKKVNIDML